MPLEVQAGDFFGFMWKSSQYAISFDWFTENPNNSSENRNYCGLNVAAPANGDTVSLTYEYDNKDSWTYRDYAIWFDGCCGESVTFNVI